MSLSGRQPGQAICGRAPLISRTDTYTPGCGLPPLVHPPARARREEYRLCPSPPPPQTPFGTSADVCNPSCCRHIRPHIGSLRLQALSPARITKLYRDLATSGGRNAAGLSPRTIEYVHAVLRKALRDAVAVDQILPSNPVERAKRPRKAPSEPGQVWTPGQLRAFLDTARQHRLFAFYRLAAYTGARRGELLNLRWRDIDLDAGEVRITGSAAVIAGQRIEGTTKSGRSRTVSIDAETVQILRDHRKRQAEDRLRVGPDWRGIDDYVFATAWGEPIHPDTVSSLLTVLINAHNDPEDSEQPSDPLPHARLHDLRHVHATTLLMSRVASDATFPGSSESPLPAAQHTGLERARSNDGSRTMGELGCHHRLASGRTMLQPVRLQQIPA